jgi:hypothetical protein
MTYDEAKATLIALNFKWYTRVFELNFVWQRTSYEATNRFTDWLHLCWLDELNVKHILTIPATTKPGLKGSLLEPVTVEGIRGTAIIQAGQQVINGWKFIDSDKGFSKYPYFHQVGKVNYWRDGNKDKVIDKVNRQIAKVFGTHWHRMSNDGTYGSGEVNNWSLGCMGAPEPEFKKLLPLTRRHASLYGNLFTGSIIDLA